MKNSRMRTNTICDLIPNWNKVRKGVEEMDKHLELFGKELMIYSINKFDYGYIFQIGLSTYSDYIFNSKTPYKFSSDCHQLPLEDNYTRSRENVIFQQGDISKMLDDKIAVDISHILGNLITVIFNYQILRKPLKILSL